MIKTTNKITSVLAIIALILFLISRFQNLLAIPVFADEAIYTRWSQLIKNVETLRFIPLTDGKQPLFMWLTVPLFKVFSDPLFASRSLSVFSGFGTLIVVYLIVNLITHYESRQSITGFLLQIVKPQPISTLAMFMYVLVPYTFFFDRLATPDNLLSFWGALTLFLSLLITKFPRLDLSLIMGGVLGFAWMTKSPTIFFIVLSIITGTILLPQKRHLILYLISATIGFSIYNFLRLGPQFHQIAIRNQDYIHPLIEVIRHPFDPFKPHFFAAIKIIVAYFSFPILVISMSGLIIKYLKKRSLQSTSLIKILLVISLWFVIPLLANCFVAKVFTGRYILYTIPHLLILVTFGMYYFFQSINHLFSSKLPIVLIIMIIFLPNIYFLSRISFDPFNTTVPATEYGYLRDWTSGWGIKSSADYFRDQSRQANVIVGTEGYFGTLPDGVQIYTDGVSQLTIFGVGLGYKQIPEKLIDARRHGDEVYLIGNRHRFQLQPDEYRLLELINSYHKPDSDQLLIYRLK